MTARWKYVIFDDPLHGEFPVIFPARLMHANIASDIVSRSPGCTIVRVGQIDDLTFSVASGRSILTIQAPPEDTDVIRRQR